MRTCSLILLYRTMKSQLRSKANDRILERVLILFILLSCTVAQASAQQETVDSLRSVIAVTEGAEKMEAYQLLTTIYGAEVNDKLKRDTLFALYDQMDAEAKKQDKTDVRAFIRKSKIRALILANLWDDVFNFAPDYLQFMADNKCWNEYFDTYSNFVNTYRRKGLYEQAVAEVQKMMDKAKQINDKGGIGAAFYTMAQIYGSQRRFADRDQCYREAIEMWRGDPQNYRRLIIAQGALAQNLIAQERMDEAMQTANELEKAILQYEEFTRSGQPELRLRLYSVFRDLYRQWLQFDKAEIYCDKIDSITGGNRPQYEERAHILNARKRYAEALEMVDKAIATNPETLKNQARGMKMVILIDSGDTQGAQQLLWQIIANIDSLNNVRIGEAVDEIRTVYEVERITADTIRIRNYFLFTLGGCVLLCVILGIWINYSRKIARKNRGLYLQIKGQDCLAEEIEALKKRYEPFMPSVHTPLPEDTDRDAPGSMQQRQLVSRLHEYLLQNRNFANPDIERDQLVAALATNKTYIFDAVKAVTGTSLQDYINNFRLEEARRLFDNQSDLNIEILAEKCGFHSYLAFYRAFRDRYKMNPAEYRKLAKMKNP